MKKRNSLTGESIVINKDNHLNLLEIEPYDIDYITLTDKYKIEIISSLKKTGIKTVKLSDISDTIWGQLYRTQALYIKINFDFLENDIFTKCPLDQNNCVSCILKQTKEKTKSKVKDYEILLANISKKMKKECPSGCKDLDINMNECHCGETIYTKEDIIYQKTRVLLHSLKHIIIHAAPKFTGASPFELSGIIFPNDTKEPVLVIMDPSEGGSGIILLLNKNIREVLKLSLEISKEINNENSKLSLFLSPIVCRNFNQDLCPIVLLNFLERVF